MNPNTFNGSVKVMECYHHHNQEAAYRCEYCGKTLCEDCFDAERKRCKGECETWTPEPLSAAKQAGGIWNRTAFKVIIAILAIIGALALLFLSICGIILLSL
ncbi:hypothetical protein AB6A23_27140 [Paenibacillus tarimensis]